VERGFAENDPYNLICLDIMMPVMDGQQTLQEIRKMEERHGIVGVDTTKVIMVTAADDSKNILKAFRQGQCEAYLTKPLDREKLITHIRDLDLID
jgi:two-component system chemotaxis response regulator CheY